MKLLMLNVLVDAVVGIPIILDVKTLIFNIAFADSSSNAKSNSLTKFSFAIILQLVAYLSNRHVLFIKKDDLTLINYITQMTSCKTILKIKEKHL